MFVYALKEKIDDEIKQIIFIIEMYLLIFFKILGMT